MRSGFAAASIILDVMALMALFWLALSTETWERVAGVLIGGLALAVNVNQKTAIWLEAGR